MSNPTFEQSLEPLKLMLDSATATLELLEKQLASAKATVEALSAGALPAMASGAPELKTTRDTSRWQLEGAYYPKGRFLLEVFNRLVHKKMSLKDVEKRFDADTVFAGQAVEGNRILFQLAQDVKDPKRFHMDQIITTKDGKELVVSNQFGVNNFPKLLRYLNSEFNIPLKMEGENPYSAKWKELLGY